MNTPLPSAAGNVLVALVAMAFLLVSCGGKHGSGQRQSRSSARPDTSACGDSGVRAAGHGTAGTSFVKAPRTVHLKMPSEPPELTPEQVRKREEALNQANPREVHK